MDSPSERQPGRSAPVAEVGTAPVDADAVERGDEAALRRSSLFANAAMPPAPVAAVRLDPARETDGTPWRDRARSLASESPSLRIGVDGSFIGRGLWRTKSAAPEPALEPRDASAAADEVPASEPLVLAPPAEEFDVGEAPSPALQSRRVRPAWWRSLLRRLQHLVTGRDRRTRTTPHPRTDDATAEAEGHAPTMGDRD